MKLQCEEFSRNYNSSRILHALVLFENFITIARGKKSNLRRSFTSAMRSSPPSACVALASELGYPGKFTAKTRSFGSSPLALPPSILPIWHQLPRAAIALTYSIQSNSQRKPHASCELHCQKQVGLLFAKRFSFEFQCAASPEIYVAKSLEFGPLQVW